MLRRTLVCVAFSFFCFSNTWVELAEGEIPYFANYAPLRSTLLPVIVLQAIIAALLLAAWQVLHRRTPRMVSIAKVLFVLACLVPAGIFSVALLRLVPAGITGVVQSKLFWPVAIAILVPSVVAFARRPQRLFALVAAGLLWSWPALLVVIFRAGSATLLRYPSSAYADGPLAPRLAAKPRLRVVWIVFDELSQSLAFDHRPAGVALPNFDLLRQQSWYASAAHSPGPSTQESIPALLLGRPVSLAVPGGPASLLLTSPGQPERLQWQDGNNVFRRARSLGVNSALVGWFHPYGRLLHRDLVACSWTAGWLLSGAEQSSFPQPLLDDVYHRIRCQMAVYPLVGHFPGYAPRSYQRQQTAERFQYLFDRAIEDVSDPGLGLVFLHLPVPHPPAIYSRTAGAYSIRGPQNYLDSLALADRTLGLLRQAVHSAGLDGQTAWIVSSDHGWRPLWRGGPDWTPEEEAVFPRSDLTAVPFFVKLPGPEQAATFDQTINTLGTAELALQILQGRVTINEQIPLILQGSGLPAGQTPAIRSRKD
ncbi:MAG: sulfatase-like hydrolase/transferase [Acidobacteria bacterium]|nr:sulfatase-like hydrolase/transferase [Acidobacteriota bacterium]